MLREARVSDKEKKRIVDEFLHLITNSKAFDSKCHNTETIDCFVLPFFEWNGVTLTMELLKKATYQELIAKLEQSPIFYPILVSSIFFHFGMAYQWKKNSNLEIPR